MGHGDARDDDEVTSVIKPAKGWYALGVLILLIGALVTGLVALSATSAAGRTYDRYARLVVPDDTKCRLTFSKAGTYQVFFEHVSAAPSRDAECKPSGSRRVEGQPVAPANLKITLIGPDGRRTEAKVSNASESFSTDKHDGTLVREVLIPASGDYSVEVGGADETTFVLAVGRGASTVLRRGLVTALAVAVSALVLGLVVLFAIAARRRGSRRALTSQEAVLLPPPSPTTLISEGWPMPPPQEQPAPPSSWMMPQTPPGWDDPPQN